MKRLLPFFVLLFLFIPRLQAIDIVIDYSFDTQNFFDTQAKRDALQAVVDRYSRVITSSLNAVAPGATGTGTPAGWRIGFTHPGTGGSFDFSTAANQGVDPLAGTSPADQYGFPGLNANEWILFAGGRPQTAAGTGGTGTGLNFSSTFDDIQGPMHRGINDNTAGAGSTNDLPRWGGSISFDTGRNWHFDPTTVAPVGTVDFYSIALHEVGHALGLATGFNTWQENGSNQYTGANAIAAANTDNGSSLTVLELTKDNPGTPGVNEGLDPHFENNVHQSFVFRDGMPNTVGTVSIGVLQDLLMDPIANFSAQQQRFELTNVDVAALQDVNWTTLASGPPPDFFRPDNRIGKSLTSAIGNGIYNTTTGQTLNLQSKRARPVRAALGVENDGNVDDSYTIAGRGSNRLFRVTYTNSGANVTAAMVAGTHATAVLSPSGATHQVSILVKPNKRKIKKVIRRPGKRIIKYRRKRFNMILRSTSTNDGTAQDVSSVRVRT